jgi:hypothetical protein
MVAFDSLLIFNDNVLSQPFGCLANGYPFYYLAVGDCPSSNFAIRNSGGKMSSTGLLRLAPRTIAELARAPAGEISNLRSRQAIQNK